MIAQDVKLQKLLFNFKNKTTMKTLRINSRKGINLRNFCEVMLKPKYDIMDFYQNNFHGSMEKYLIKNGNIEETEYHLSAYEKVCFKLSRRPNRKADLLYLVLININEDYTTFAKELEEKHQVRLILEPSEEVMSSNEAEARTNFIVASIIVILAIALILIL